MSENRPRGRGRVRPDRSRSRSRERESSHGEDRSRQGSSYSRDNRSQPYQRAGDDRQQSYQQPHGSEDRYRGQNTGFERNTRGDGGYRGGADRGGFGGGGGRGGRGGGGYGGGREEVPSVLPETMEVYTNFFEIITPQEWKLNQYHVDFEPHIDNKRLRVGLLLTTHASLFKGNRAFDGTQLYTSTQLPEYLELTSVNSFTNENIKIIIRKTSEIKPATPEYVRLLNIVLKRCLSICKFKEMGRKRAYFNMDLSEQFEHINVVSGYMASIEIYSNRLLMCAEMAHKLINRYTVLDYISQKMSNVQGDLARLRDIIPQELIGQTVITRYNNKTYKIDDIVWNKTPRDTFDTKKGTSSFMDYYKNQYNLDISDTRQPLLMSNPRARDKKAAEQAGRTLTPALLIPELCYLTGPVLLKPFERNFQAKNALQRITKQNPNNTHTQLVKLVDQIKNNAETRVELDKWSVRLSEDVVKFDTKVIGQKNAIVFGNGKKWDKAHMSWNNMFREAQLLTCVPIREWILVYGARDEQTANSVEDELKFVTRPLGVDVSQAERIRLQDARNAYSFAIALKERLAHARPKLVVCIIPSQNKDIYDAIKKLCCIDFGLPSQVLTAPVLQKNTRSVMTKVALQISAKLGAEVWGMAMPANNMMVVGMNVYKDQEQASKTVAAFVSSLNGTHPEKLNCTKWLSQVSLQPAGQEFADNLSTLMLESLRRYYQRNNNQYPQRIFVYRDGVNETQYDVVRDHEVAQLLRAFEMIDEAYKPQLSVIIVKKRSNARFYIKSGRNELINPYVGTVIDSHVVDKVDRDFYLISQQTNQGTVNPTHYDIIYNTNEFGAGRSALGPIQALTYKLTHLYYNWPGHIRVPAPCHYAYKLAFLTANSLHKCHDKNLNENLFYL